MTICPICGKPYSPLANCMPTIPSFPNEYCNGIHITLYTSNTTAAILPMQPFNVTPTTFSFSGQFDQTDSFREWLDAELMKRIQPEPQEEQPLKWSEVESQLDAFMATLNRGKK